MKANAPVVINESLVRLAFGGMAPRTIDRLFERYGNESQIVSAIVKGRTRAKTRTIAAVALPFEQRVEELAALDARFVAADSVEVPERLRRYEDAPRWLFVRGAGSERPSIGIVGTRTCTTYGTDLAEAYGRVAADLGCSVVSGLARGIDGAAHRGATKVGGH